MPDLAEPDRAAEPMNDTDAGRWNAVLHRDHNADGVFWYGVMTTGIYCRPPCASRPAKRENVRFFVTREAARAAGLRACKRCRPDEAGMDATRAGHGCRLG